MYTVMIPKTLHNHDAVEWAKENCPSWTEINTRAIRETNEKVYLFKFKNRQDSILFALRWL